MDGARIMDDTRDISLLSSLRVSDTAGSEAHSKKTSFEFRSLEPTSVVVGSYTMLFNRREKKIQVKKTKEKKKNTLMEQ